MTVIAAYYAHVVLPNLQLKQTFFLKYIFILSNIFQLTSNVTALIGCDGKSKPIYCVI